MAQAQPFLEQKIHPTIIIQAYRAALEDMVKLAEEKYSKPVDINNEKEKNISFRVTTVVQSCLGTKMISKWMDLAVQISLDAIKTIRVEKGNTSEIDIKRYCRIEKIPGGTIEDCKVIKGVVLNKLSYLVTFQDVTHAKMRRRIENPRIVLLDCNLEYKKGESQTSLEIMKEEDISRILEQEEESIRKQCDDIIRVKPDLVFTEKGISDLAQHFLLKAGITAIRRLKKTDNNRLARL
ncbi:unnamed protein product, partial [Strongylus vulgaris]